MKAEILRNVVASIFSIKATSIELEGEISPKYETDNSHSYGSLYTSTNWEKLYGFSPKKGFILLESNTESGTSNADGSWNISKEVRLDLVKGVEEFMFFISKGGRYYSDCNGQKEDFEYVKLYKTPNFREYFDKMEAADIERWQKWAA